MTEQVIPVHDEFSIKPDEECILCGEKHYSYAKRLAQEIGYVAVNRQDIIGELVAAQAHTNKYDEELANKIRDIRHLVQERTEILIDWNPICIRFDELIAADKAESLKKFSDMVSWFKSLVGEKPIPPEKVKRLEELFGAFSSERNRGGGCSSCKLKRLNRQYREILGKEF